MNGEEIKSRRKWSGRTFGTATMHRWLIAVLRVMPLWMLYFFTFTVVLPTILPFQWRSLGLIYRFARAAGRGPVRAAFTAVANIYCFASVVMDRFAMYAGKRFKIVVDGYEIFDNAMHSPLGVVILSSHLGNFELAGYSMFSRHKRFNAVVFGLEKDTIMQQRHLMLSRNNMSLITATPAMDHVFQINAALDSGEVVAIPADRLFGSTKSFRLPSVGGAGTFPRGAFAVAAMKPAVILQLTVLKRSLKTYRVVVEPIIADSSLPASRRALQIASVFASNLARLARLHPSLL